MIDNYADSKLYDSLIFWMFNVEYPTRLFSRQDIDLFYFLITLKAAKSFALIISRSIFHQLFRKFYTCHLACNFKFHELKFLMVYTAIDYYGSIIFLQIKQQEEIG